MSTYTELKGLKVKFLDSDPSPGADGDVWYNSASGQLKAFVGQAAWSASSPIITARTAVGGTGTTQNAVLITGGLTTPPATVYANTEEYDGSGWSTSGNLNTARRDITLFGTQTSAVGAGGGTPTYTNSSESYNGSTWTATPNINTTRSLAASAGASNTSGIMFGGFTPPITAVTEEWNGSAWTNVNNMNTARHNVEGVGVETAALGFAGSDPNQSVHTEEYDGTNWTTVNNMPTGVGELGGAGTQTSAIGAGGYTTTTNAGSYTYDGTNWSNAPNLSTARYGSGAGGSSANSAVAAGGYTGTTSTAVTEEFNNTFEVITAGAWASGGNMPVAVYGGASFGIQTSAVHSAGVPPANQAANNTYEYNGSAWSSGGALPANRQQVAGAGASETSGLAFCGSIPTNNQPSFTFHNNTYEYDGSSWTNGGNYTATLTGVGGAGTQTAAIGAGGTSTAPGAPGMTNTSATYNGSSWTAGPNTGTSATRPNMVTGTTTSAVSIANTPPFGCEEFDGSSWTTGGVPIHAGYSRIHTGTSNSDALVAGGDATPRAQCESYNGTAWSTSPNLATARASIGSGRGVNPTATALAFGGYSPPGNSNSTEEFTAESSTATASTIDFD